MSFGQQCLLNHLIKDYTYLVTKLSLLVLKSFPDCPYEILSYRILSCQIVTFTYSYQIAKIVS